MVAFSWSGSLEGFLEQVKGTITVSETLDVREALTELVGRLIECSVPKLSPLLTGVISQAQSDPEIAAALRDQWIAPRRAISMGVIKSAVTAGELRPDIDVGVAADQLFAPLYYRSVFGMDQYTPEDSSVLVNQLLGSLTVD